MEQQIKNAFFGFAVGDALGVPVEFQSRRKIAENPVTDMREFGTHNQPKGTWSDDSSMAFCLAESLATPPNTEKTEVYDIGDIANNFVRWYYDKFWTPHGRVFDIGIATVGAIQRLKKGESPLLSGGIGERSNGNGSLMRILPLVFYKGYFFEENIEKRFKLVSEVSSITHMHFRSVFSCFIYTEFANILRHQIEDNKQDKVVAYQELQKRINDFALEFEFNTEEVALFDRILKHDITTFDEDSISSSGYVLHTLEASLWCFMKYDSYSESVLKAVNLGKDTDTTGCVTGGIAGLYYGANAETGIPQEWIDVIVKKEEIEDLCNRLYTLNQ
ncbi:ADP-ribosylglycohydrolase family protein [Bernardetia sp.]|uniref:ADP-ribosylglycohydrolase family protein n=1 Tax=Bernardetia sp. TaxID=1937974 RepID=UPI0025BC90DE|nr:ADP-ribosylglycohydrolase family protein [Bernardetia sp.]